MMVSVKISRITANVIHNLGTAIFTYVRTVKKTTTHVFRALNHCWCVVECW